MATIFEMARALGEELQKTPQVEALVAAKAAYESDPEIAKLVEEYTKLHYDFEAKQSEPISWHLICTLRNRISITS